MKQTVTSKYEPKSKNVTWIDMSTGHPVLKNFINGMWRPTGCGNGTGSSNPTEADATKVWQVTPVQKDTRTEETVIVPEQTLIGGKTELEYNDKFVPGTQCVAVINGVEYRGEVNLDGKGNYIFEKEFGAFMYDQLDEIFQFYNYTDSPEVTAKLSVIEETPTYDYNWAPGVKIPIPTAEDEGKILVVTKTEGNTSTIVPEQEVPADNSTPLTDVDLKYFVPGNTVTATVTYEVQGDEGGENEGPLKGVKSSNSQTMIVSGTIEQEKTPAGTVNYVIFNEGQENEFEIAKIPYGEPVIPFGLGEGVIKSINTKSSTDTDYVLVTSLGLVISSSSIEPSRGNTLPYATIKLEYIEQNYEYQLQENSGGSGGGSNILYCEGSDDGHGLITAYINSSELENPQITTIAVDTDGVNYYFYRMSSSNWLVSGFNTFSDPDEWVKGWNTEGQYPTIVAYFSQK